MRGCTLSHISPLKSLLIQMILFVTGDWVSKYLHHSGELSNMFICTNVLGQQFYLFITRKFISNMTPSLANNSSHVIVGGVHADHLTRQTLQLPGKTFPENWIFIFITHYLLLMSSDHIHILIILIIDTRMVEIGYHYTHITLTPHRHHYTMCITLHCL